MEIDPNLSLERKQTILGERQNDGLAKLNAVLTVAETEEPTKKARYPLVSNIKSGAPFLVEIFGRNNIPENFGYSFGQGGRLVRKGFEPVTSETEFPVLTHEVERGDTLLEILREKLENN